MIDGFGGGRRDSEKSKATAGFWFTRCSPSLGIGAGGDEAVGGLIHAMNKQ